MKNIIPLLFLMTITSVLFSQTTIDEDSIFGSEIISKLNKLETANEKMDSIDSWKSPLLSKETASKYKTLAKIGIQIAGENDSLRRKMLYQNDLLFFHWMTGKYELVGDLADEVTDYYLSVGEKKNVPGIQSFKAMNEEMLGNYDKAYEIQLELLKFSEDLGDKSFISSCYLSLAKILLKLNRQEEGQEYLDKGIAIANEVDEYNYRVSIEGVKYSYLLYSKKYDEAMALLKAVDTSKFKHKNEMTQHLSKKAKVLLGLKRYDEAEGLFETLYENSKNYINAKYDGEIVSSLGEVAFHKGDYQKAINYKLRNLESSKKYKSQENKVEDLDILSKSYYQLNDYKNSHKYLTQYSDVKDSIFTLEKDRITSNLRAKFESDKKDQKLVAQENELKQSAIIQKFGIISGALLLLLLGGLISIVRSKQKFNKELQVKNSQIKIKSDQNELLLKEIHHRVKNNLQTISSLLFLQSQNLSDKEAQNTINVSQQRVESIALIHKNLYQRENLSAIELKGYFSKLIENLSRAYNTSNRIDVKIKMEEAEVDVDTAIPLGLIVNELITNALKHAFPNNQNGHIEVLFTKTEETHKLKVSDNGIGKQINVKENFGSQLIALLTNQIEGTINSDSNNGYSCEITF